MLDTLGQKSCIFRKNVINKEHFGANEPKIRRNFGPGLFRPEFSKPEVQIEKGKFSKFNLFHIPYTPQISSDIFFKLLLKATKEDNKSLELALLLVFYKIF